MAMQAATVWTALTYEILCAQGNLWLFLHFVQHTPEDLPMDTHHAHLINQTGGWAASISHRKIL